MARSVKAGKTGIKGKKETFTLEFDSRYGSHANMVVDADSDEAKTFLGDRSLTEGEIICKDKDMYVTQDWRLDNGMADPNRMYKA